MVPLQQPFGHEVALQTQAPPFVPQVAADGGEWHCLLPSQQPPAHDDPLQTQLPFEHV